MANLDAPRGFRAVENGVAGQVPRLRKYTVAASTAVYEGDIVGLNASGLVIVYTDADAVAGDLIGVAAHHVPSGGAGPSSDLSLLVYDDPQQVFEVQADDNSLTTLADYLYQCFDIVNTTGDTALLQSKQELDASSATSVFGTNTTTIRPVVCIGRSEAINNTANVSYTKYLVQIHPNAHIRGGGGLSAIGGGL